MNVQEEKSFSIVIDLGLTHSSVAYYDIVKNEPILIEDEIGKERIASCRIIGRDECDVSYEDREHWPFKLKSRDDGSAYIECYNPLTQESEEFEPEEISGIILKYLYEIAQAKLGNQPISNVVVTVPAEFNDIQRASILLACKLSGTKNVELANEPTAAIAGYKRKYPNSLKNGDRIVVIDFGGTLDVTCFKIVNDSVVVESSGGNQDLGGNEFDNVMNDIIKKRIEKVIPGYYKQKQVMTQKETIFNKKLTKLKKNQKELKLN
ncbi:heat shock protein 70kD, putative [Entamoeba dispar SAW760]|uniref:Heat shock protein 70kD, putative n=1 Tax=Entamoeba dispar (strain ATCC PRA-260 / SAW760) TaxID=370354 RepID=B0ECN6_ENTDS|nr:heat shock protein 70kD, putative [Entamoeba dispar SAW760]EDR27709.1 heat shock protein 70kD, putative [Entamoeba dispar SAW760]|eukprot:EDR27709.1 heat shock protein 70kD, putative [Entamoeba dispar SAW760]